MQTSQSAGQSVGPKPTFTADGGDTHLKVDESLPDAFKHKFFRKPESWSDQKLANWIDKNPINDLCLRLATYQSGPNGVGCYDPKRSSEPVIGSKRLYLMIGRALPITTYRRMLLASDRQWKFVEECWIANMHTVLLNQYFDPVRRDRSLFKSIQRYKLWFVNFAFSGQKKTICRKDGSRRTVFVPSNFEKLLKGLKDIAGCLQWVALSDMKEHNAPHPTVPYWRGYDPSTGVVELTWFSGHLSFWRGCLTAQQFTDRELANLCQIRTFGRALPCPTRQMCEYAFAEQMEILSLERKTDPKVLEVVKGFSVGLGRKLGVREMPVSTHVSVSTSGCFERSQRDGGIAAEVSRWIEILDVPMSQVRVGSRVTPGAFPITLTELMLESPGQEIDIRDVYGELLFPRPKSFYGFSNLLKATRLKSKELTFLQALYEGAGLSSKRRKASKLIGEESLPSQLGKAVLLVASAFALEQGEYLSDLNGQPVLFDSYLHVGGIAIPVANSSNMRFHLIYRPLSMPKTKLDCLAEPGAKTRPLGKNQAWFTMVSRAMRFMAEPIIARDGRARIGLRSTNKMWSFLKYIKKVGPEFEDPIGQSADLKSATDLIPLDIIEAIWDGLLHSLPKSHPFWVFYSLIKSKRAMFIAPKFKSLEGRFRPGSLNQRGSFMGEPMSFLTLSLVLVLTEEISDYYHGLSLPLWSTPKVLTPMGRNPCAICGDDLAALRAKLSRILAWRQVALDMGLKFSWKEGISRRIMIFCEDHTLLKGKGEQFQTVYIDVIKSRLLTTMSREHSDNRSSILGKGRMLSNQLDYFEDKNLKIAILGYFRNIFDRCFSYGVLRNEACRMPIYLPPSCGGMGFPIVDSIMPTFMWPYIGHIFDLLDIEDEAERYCALQRVSSLNHRVKHGFSSDTSGVLKQVFEGFRRAIPGEKRVTGNSIYNDDFVITLLNEVYSLDVPTDPYTNKYDYSALRNEASRIGFVPLSQLAEEVERVLNFNSFLKGVVGREPRTFNKWLRDSKRYWRNVIPGFRTSEYTRLFKKGKQQFKTVGDLERKVTRGFSGWIYVGSDLQHLNLMNSGPSLKITFSRSSTLGGRLLLYNEKAPTD